MHDPHGKFTCAMCKNEYKRSGRTEEELLREERATFGFNGGPDERQEVCEDCWAEACAMVGVIPGGPNTPRE